VAFEGPLFLVGMPRSGTKLLRDLLNRHSRIRIPDVETEFLPWLASRSGNYGNLADRASFERLFKDMARCSYFQYRRETGQAVDADRWFAACVGTDAGALFEAFIRSEVGAEPGGGCIWGDKSPSYVDDLPLIDRLFPAARVLHLVRDVRDYCLSIHDAWGKDMRRAAQRWVDGVRTARRDGAALGERYMELRYEDLLQDPETELRRVCRFLEVEFQPAMMTLERPAENLGSARGLLHVANANHGKFAQRMEPGLLRAIEALAGQTLQEFSYKLALAAQPQCRLSASRLRLAQLHDAVQLLRRGREGRSVIGAFWFHLRYFVTTRG
jgi:hypothetical protein